MPLDWVSSCWSDLSQPGASRWWDRGSDDAAEVFRLSRIAILNSTETGGSSQSTCGSDLKPLASSNIAREVPAVHANLTIQCSCRYSIQHAIGVRSALRRFRHVRLRSQRLS